jgi:hypothetical protein
MRENERAFEAIGPKPLKGGVGMKGNLFPGSVV